ncbi:dienelactone hydrolase family protein [Dolichospermum sp. ST_con]|nr:dienelactone hydrolase family protein [Dolichospermum sp. ST_con]MDD1419619.1 dienelactone hydrolase family protein [Dolichospermum sp. ST_sed1]MDD1422897.1 dienelactone hydrolase family protein [Dolichospermum sp. ST_sed9]MDD1430652.1 dienelactone hydrolase family protein [Dolichospermum sp. ST_sed6]MDD1439446.1 dienelactone hydrolase family protein [Dolichospermum sp. ST_sed3]MDD1445859.1 dienelactone hydrolase family protein [Dolichospermum sp. ST_sed8]MDD1453904.1 dienelactone hydrolas
MTEPAIQTKIIQIPEDNRQMAAYLAKPTAAGSYPGIVVLQEIFGVNVHIRDVTERIAQLGYVAIAPALFQRQSPGFETGYTPKDVEIGRQHAAQTTASELLSDIQAAINYLKTLPEVKPDGFGCIGFCFGGHVAYLAATLSDIKATASFYGAGITSRTPGGGNPTITRTSEIKGTIYTFFGQKDASIPSEQVDEIAAEFAKYNISHRLFRYDGSDHGFFCDRRASYNSKAAADAWEQVQELFSQLS